MAEILTVGIMTGNSLDAVDAVLTSFSRNKIKDLSAWSKAYPSDLTAKMLKLRKIIQSVDADMNKLANDAEFISIVNEYTRLVAQTVNELIDHSGFDKNTIAALGFHGQTCDHFPPSIAGQAPAYTLQVGNAQLLADLTGIPVIYDFRSDDIMAGGEGAPLAPVHNLHISHDLKTKGCFPVAFCNAGNTGNIAVVTEDENKKTVVKGWDVGPFNHYTDSLMRLHKNLPFDQDGKFAKKGKIIPELLAELFNHAAVNKDNLNFYLLNPPKSSDPSWYRMIESLNCRNYSFEDTLRTVLYLSTYTFFHTLGYIPENYKMPSNFLVFGGGWKNSLAMADFKNLLVGHMPVLSEHKDLFATIRRRFRCEPTVQWSNNFGCNGQYMEARIFADMAYCRIIGEAFTFQKNGSSIKPVVGGIYVLPSGKKDYLLCALLKKYQTEDLNKEIPAPKYWNRASKGWQKR